MQHATRSRVFIFWSLLFAATLGGCGGSGNNNSNSTTYQGTVAGTGGVTGTLTVTVNTVVANSSHFSLIREARAQSSLDIPATGNCILANGGGTIPLNGTFTPTSGAINLTGGGYTFTGTIPPGTGQMSGTFTGPGGVSGGFSAISTANNVTANTFCGKFNGGGTGTDFGTFNVNIDPVSGNLNGSATPDSASTGQPVTLTGKAVNATTFNGCSNQCAPFCAVVQGSVLNGNFLSNGTTIGCFSGNQATGNPPACNTSAASCDPTAPQVCTPPTSCNGIPSGCP
jgi:hypothetical protein